MSQNGTDPLNRFGCGPTILPSNILLEKMLGQWLVLSSFTNWLWKKYEKIYWWLLFLTKQWKFGTNSYKFFIPAFLNHKFPFKIPSVAGEIPWNSSIFRSRKSQWLFWWSSSGSPAGRLWLDPMWLGSWTVRVPRERTDQGWPFDDFCWLVTSEFWSRLKTAKELLLIYIWRSPDVFCTLDFDLAPCNYGVQR